MNPITPLTNTVMTEVIKEMMLPRQAVGLQQKTPGGSVVQAAGGIATTINNAVMVGTILGAGLILVLLSREVRSWTS